MKTIAPNIAIPIVNPMAFATLNTLERKRLSGMSGSAARRSCRTKSASSATPASAEPDDRAPSPRRTALPPQVVSRTSEPTPPVSSAAPRKSIRWRAARRGQVQPQRDDRDGERADRHVDVEDPAPREGVDEEAAEQRPGDRGDGEHRADQAHVAAALARRDDVGDDRLRADHQAAGADALQRAEARSARPSTG